MKRRRLFLLLPLLCLSLSGCVDDRIKRASSLLNVKTQVAAKEFEAATTPALKAEVAKRYFDNAPTMTQVLEDYMFGRKPQSQPLPAPTP